MRSTGTHRLIRQGAKLVEGVEDILEEIRPLIRTPFGNRALTVEKPDSQNQSLEGEKIISRILDKVPKHIDEIAREAKMSIQHAASILLDLELRGLVSQLPGKYFISGL
jgi:DNA processing protein